MESFIYLEEEIQVSVLSAGEVAFQAEKGVISISYLPMSRPVQGLVGPRVGLWLRRAEALPTSLHLVPSSAGSY